MHPRAQPGFGFGPTSVRNAVSAPSDGWNCTKMYLIVQSSWMWNKLGWKNQVWRGSVSSQIYQDLPRFAVAFCCDLGFFGMSWRSRRVSLEFLPSWHPEGSCAHLPSLMHWVQFYILLTDLWNLACDHPPSLGNRAQLSLYGISLQRWVTSKSFLRSCTL